MKKLQFSIIMFLLLFLGFFYLSTDLKAEPFGEGGQVGLDPLVIAPSISEASRLRARQILDGSGVVFMGGRFQVISAPNP